MGFLKCYGYNCYAFFMPQSVSLLKKYIAVSQATWPHPTLFADLTLPSHYLALEFLLNVRR